MEVYPNPKEETARACETRSADDHKRVWGVSAGSMWPRGDGSHLRQLGVSSHTVCNLPRQFSPTVRAVLSLDGVVGYVCAFSAVGSGQRTAGKQ